MITNNSVLTDRLTEERERLGLNQADFGRLGGVGKNTQSNYETGATSPTAAYLQALMGHGVDSVYVLTGRRIRGEKEVLAPDEGALVRYFRACNASDRAHSLAVLKALARNTDLSHQLGGGRSGGPPEPPSVHEAGEAYSVTQPEPPMVHRETMWSGHSKGKRGKQ